MAFNIQQAMQQMKDAQERIRRLKRRAPRAVRADKLTIAALERAEDPQLTRALELLVGTIQ